MVKRTRCVVCGSPLYKEALFNLQNFPGGGTQELINAENFEQDKSINKEIYQCSGCGLVQFADGPVSYFKDQTRAGERSKSLIELRKIQYRHFIETYHLTGKKIIEIGAGKGGFYDIVNDHISYFDQDTLRFFLEKNGFEIEEIGEVATVYNFAIVRKRKKI